MNKPTDAWHRVYKINPERMACEPFTSYEYAIDSVEETAHAFWAAIHAYWYLYRDQLGKPYYEVMPNHMLVQNMKTLDMFYVKVEFDGGLRIVGKTKLDFDPRLPPHIACDKALQGLNIQ